VSLNWREIDAVLAELPLAGSQIQKIRQPDFSSLVLELHGPQGRYDLYISLAQNATRIHRLTRKVENTVELQRFAQLLRARLQNARITGARQIGQDRIVKLDMVRSGVETVLWVRLWNNAANVIFTEPGGSIIDAFYRRPGRGEVSGGFFAPHVKGEAEKRPEREYTVRDFPGEGDLNGRIEEYYAALRSETETGRLRERIGKLLDQAEARLLGSIEEAEARLGSDEEITRYKQTGDLLMSNLHAVQPGERWVTIENFYNENKTITIELDPSIPPEKNAERFYENARKLRKRLELARGEIESFEQELAGVREKARKLESETDPGVLKRMLESLRGGAAQVTDRERDRVPGLLFRSGPFTILVGRTSLENDELLRKHVRGNDYWLHSRDTPGAYVFVKSTKGKSVPLEVLLDAGNLALHYSKAKSAGKCELYYTQVKYLRRVKEGKRGLVIPTQEKNLSIRRDEERLRRLLGRETEG